MLSFFNSHGILLGMGMGVKASRAANPDGVPGRAWPKCGEISMGWGGLLGGYDSRKLDSFLDRVGCRSFRSAFASIWRILSRVT